MDPLDDPARRRVDADHALLALVGDPHGTTRVRQGDRAGAHLDGLAVHSVEGHGADAVRRQRRDLARTCDPVGPCADEHRRERHHRRERQPTPATTAQPRRANPAASRRGRRSGGSGRFVRCHRHTVAGLVSAGMPWGQARVLPQHPLVEGLKLRPGVDAELLPEDRANGAVGRQGVDLTAGPVESEHALTLKSLPERVLSHEPPQLGDERRVVPLSQLRLDPVLRCREPDLREPPREGVHEAEVGQVREHLTAPEGERL